MDNTKHQLVLLNDDVNSFDDVIDSLMEVLGHNIFQAEQCATIIHNSGRCVIKSGTKTELDFYKKLLTKQELNITIEETPL
jgi:ATP-dependent Clp protease adaptor protein ClpS